MGDSFDGHGRRRDSALIPASKAANGRVDTNHAPTRPKSLDNPVRPRKLVFGAFRFVATNVTIESFPFIPPRMETTLGFL